MQSLSLSLLVSFLSSYTYHYWRLAFLSPGVISLIVPSLIFAHTPTTTGDLPSLVTRCNLSHCPFSYFCSYTYHHWRLAFSCHQMKILSVSFLFSDNLFSPLIHPSDEANAMWLKSSYTASDIIHPSCQGYQMTPALGPNSLTMYEQKEFMNCETRTPVFFAYSGMDGQFRNSALHIISLLF